MSPNVNWIIVATFMVAAIATGWMRRFALNSKLLDVPNLRSSHTSPTPRAGGVAIVLAFFGAVTALALVGLLNVSVWGALLVSGGAMAIVGFVDDRRPLPARVRFSVHVSAAVLAVILVGGVPERSLNGLALYAPWIGGLLGVLALVWVSNLFNFMDGIDGIAGSEAIFVAVSGAWFNAWQGGNLGLTGAMLCLAAASLGFLLWNWPPAKIFMGDVGSGFLGFALATMGLACSQKGMLPAGVWVILGGVFLVDATVTLLRRVMRGDRWFEAHRIHAYQHLTRRWGAHRPVTGVAMIINVLWLLPWAWAAASVPSAAHWCVAAALIPLTILAIAVGAGRKEK